MKEPRQGYEEMNEGSGVRAGVLRNLMNYKFAVVNKKLSHNSYKIFICSKVEEKRRIFKSKDFLLVSDFITNSGCS